MLASTVHQERSTAMGYHFKEAEIDPQLLSTLEAIIGRMHGSQPRTNDPTGLPPAIAELLSSIASMARQSVESAETMLYVGSLQLDLIDRTARRGDRPIKLLPREFLLLKYMMQRSGRLVTRDSLFKDVWNYKFVPESNVVDVQMGRLRRKIDGKGETPMIHNVRGSGFVLSAA
jgi:two-component system, OmpR family, response regulator